MLATPAMLKKALLVAFGTLIGLLLIEVGLRVHYRLTLPGQLSDLSRAAPRPDVGATVTLAGLLRPSPDPDIVYELKPSVDVRFFLHGERVVTNAQGWRDHEYGAAAPDPGVIRIVGIGDSVMYGWGVDVRRRYSAVLLELLREAYPDQRFEMRILAAPGYNLPMEVAALERDGLDPPPDLVLYGFVANDHCLPNFLVPTLDVFGPTSFLAHYLAGRNLVPKGLVRDEELVPGAEDELACRPEAVEPQYRHLVGPAPFQRALAALERVGAERDIPSVLIRHPLGPGIELPDSMGAIVVVDAAPYLDPARHQLRTWDPHPNGKGHAVIARIVFEELERRGIWSELVSERR